MSKYSNVATIAIAAGLFNRKDKYLNDKKILDEIPNKTFGFFVSVKRGRPLSSWPEDIHGCIGHWDPSFDVMNDSDIIKNMKKVAKSATYEDNRRTYFTDPIEIDILTKYEVIFMLQPLMKIDSNGMIIDINERFDNMKYGLIIMQNGYALSTYLPEVFFDTEWDKIRSSLINKAGLNLSGSSDAMFYAYHGVAVSRTLRSYFTEPVINFFEDKYKTVPYEVDNGLRVSYDEEQYVRNSATIRDILNLGLGPDGYVLSSNIKQKILMELQHLVEIFHNDPIIVRQALPFIMISLKLLNDINNYGREFDGSNIDVIHHMAKYLTTSVKNNVLEPIFEYGEVLSGLAEIVDYLDDISALNLEQLLKSEHEKILGNCNKMSNNVKTDDIFKLNWYSQALVSAYRNDIAIDDYQKNAKIMAGMIVSISINFSSSTESNYLAVAFESLCGLLCILQKDEPIKNKIADLMKLLESRMNNYGLIKFIAGNSRVDVTGHFLNGIHHLMFYHNIKLSKSPHNEYLKNKSAYNRLKNKNVVDL